jgi:ribosomal-protein-serine acetyltransferase
MAELLPDRIEGDGLVLRTYSVPDVPALATAVTESLEHLRPWMPWIAFEPASLESRTALVVGWDADWASGGDAVYGIFEEGRLVGSTGLHRRRGPSVLEVGYWVHVAHTGRGVATRTTRLLTNAALRQPGITAVEIVHDAANGPSGAVPRRLGFTHVATEPGVIKAPGERGVDWIWRTEQPV